MVGGGGKGRAAAAEAFFFGVRRRAVAVSLSGACEPAPARDFAGLMPARDPRDQRNRFAGRALSEAAGERGMDGGQAGR